MLFHSGKNIAKPFLFKEHFFHVLCNVNLFNQALLHTFALILLFRAVETRIFIFAICYVPHIEQITRGKTGMLQWHPRLHHYSNLSSVHSCGTEAYVRCESGCIQKSLFIVQLRASVM